MYTCFGGSVLVTEANTCLDSIRLAQTGSDTLRYLTLNDWQALLNKGLWSVLGSSWKSQQARWHERATRRRMIPLKTFVSERRVTLS